MKIRRSARTILTTLGILLVFTTLTVWHNHIPGNMSLSEQTDLRDSLALKIPSLTSFLSRPELHQQAHGFYVIGRLPAKAGHACYRDPITQWWIGVEQPLIRYRSAADLLRIIARISKDQPEILEALVLSNHEILLEAPLRPSLRLMVSLLLGLVGLLVIKRVNL